MEMVLTPQELMMSLDDKENEVKCRARAPSSVRVTTAHRLALEPNLIEKEEILSICDTGKEQNAELWFIKSPLVKLKWEIP